MKNILVILTFLILPASSFSNSLDHVVLLENCLSETLKVEFGEQISKKELVRGIRVLQSYPALHVSLLAEPYSTMSFLVRLPVCSDESCPRKDWEVLQWRLKTVKHTSVSCYDPQEDDQGSDQGTGQGQDQAPDEQEQKQEDKEDGGVTGTT